MRKVVQEVLTLSDTDIFCLSRGRYMHVKQFLGQRQATLSGYWLVVSSLNYWFLAQGTPEYLQFLLPLCPWIGRQHVNASYNRWWMALACQSLTLWVFSNFIIYPFLYSLQSSTYDKMVFGDGEWARFPRNVPCLSGVKFFVRSTLQYRIKQEAVLRTFAVIKIEKHE